MTSVSSTFTIQELVSSTNPTQGDYVVELYGNTYIHQNQQAGSITAYQQDNLGKMHLIDTICGGQLVQQLSGAVDGRHFAFITYYPQPEISTLQIGDASVYYMDTLTNTMECVHSWPIHSVGELGASQAHGAAMLFFSLNGKFAIFADGYTMHIQSLYTDDAERRISMSYSVEDEWEDLGNSQPSGFIQGSDYLLWWKPSGHLAMIDLLSDGRVEYYPLSPSIQLESANLSGCWLHNDYLIHVNPKTLCADIYHVNPIEHTMTRTESIAIEQPNTIQCTSGPDSQSVILHYADTDKSQFIVHPGGVRNLDFRYGSGVYDKSTPHGTARLVQLCHQPATTTL
jgi:hypothetical protein